MNLWDEVNEIGKHRVVAQIGGFRPCSEQYDVFGGGFYLPIGSEWPTDETGNMVPIIQFKPPLSMKTYFGDSELVQIFLNNEELPYDESQLGVSSNGDKWLIKEYSSIDNMVLFKTPRDADKYKTFPVKWVETDDLDFPSWEELGTFLSNEDIYLESNSSRYFDEFQPYYKTKIGGYAAYIQSGIDDRYEFVMQIASEEKPGFMVADNGNIYLYRDKVDKSWKLYWDCF